MYGASTLPMISLRSWFSITMTKTDPVHCGGRVAGDVLIALQATSVLPALLGPHAVPARAAAHAMARRAAVLRMNSQMHTDRRATSIARCTSATEHAHRHAKVFRSEDHAAKSLREAQNFHPTGRSVGTAVAKIKAWSDAGALNNGGSRGLADAGRGGSSRSRLALSGAAAVFFADQENEGDPAEREHDVDDRERADGPAAMRAHEDHHRRDDRPQADCDRVDRRLADELFHARRDEEQRVARRVLQG